MTNLETLPTSPYLQGTKIQFAWDSTSLGYLKTCPRLYQYHMLEGYVPKDESVHLRFGGEYHAAIQDFENFRADGLGFEDAVRNTIRNLLVRIADFDPDPTTKAGRYKNPRTLLQLVVDYLDEYKDDPCETYVLENGKPGVELSFRFELDWGPEAQTPTDENPNVQPYLLCGHLDRVVTYNDELMIVDHKTTTTTPSDYYFAGYSPNNQMTLYTFAGEVVLDTIIKGVIVEAAQICLEQPNKFVRSPQYRSNEVIEEWLRDLEYWLNAAEAYAAADHWPMNDTACGNYGGCKFREVCSRPAAIRDRLLAADFVKLEEKDRWNPLRSR